MNHYDVLEVSQRASPEVLKAAYKSLMQRYHPDKNPGNQDAAARSGMITHAYDVLSDATRRTAYDNSISQMPDSYVATHGRSGSLKQTPITHPAESSPEGKRSLLYFWMLVVITIILSGWISLYLLKKRRPSDLPLTVPSVAVSEAENKATSNQNGIAVETYNQNQNQNVDDASLTVRLPLAMIVSLKDSSALQDASPTLPTRRPSVLAIPTLLIQIGSSDSVSVIRVLEQNKLSIQKTLEERLTDANADQLVKTSGELYLRKFILDAVQEIVRSSSDTPPVSASGTFDQYGVTGISLPDSFSLK
jgi:curved DNA-binding protein CbpA